MKSQLNKLTALICNFTLMVQCNYQEPIAPNKKPIVENIKPAPIKSAHDPKKNKNRPKITHQKTDGEIYLSKIVPDERIDEFHLAISESTMLTVGYDHDKKSGKIDESNFLKYRDDLTRAYAILLHQKMIEIKGSGRLLTMELNNCGNNLIELINQFTK